MKKVFVSIYDCVPGMRIAEDVFNEYGAVVVAENMILDDRMITVIENLGIEKVRVYDTDGEIIVAGGAELFRAQYNENVDTVKNVIHDISAGRQIDIEEVNKATGTMLSRINENRDIVASINQMRDADEYLYTHSVNVALLSMLIGKWLKYGYYDVRSLVNAGFLHDIGKGKISADIINKPAPLNEEEYEEIKKHPAYGFKIAEKIPDLSDDIRKGILMHHEREDGSGYPFGLVGDKIHRYAKIIAVADVYDAMTSNRCYRDMICPFEVIGHMEVNCFKLLDQRVLNVFLKNIASYYLGDYVKLSTGDIGEIIYINPFNISKPIVRVDDIYIDLAREKQVRILELI